MADLAPGTIVDVDLGEPPATKGHEQQKRRPCVVVVHLTKLGLLVVIPISGNRPTHVAFTSLALAASAANGLAKDSYALCHQVRSVSPERMKKVRGQLGALDLERVRGVLKGMMQL
ncbi:MAG: type II toxin-antitoxin system PemK/MazF family toxin [Flavobacteriales bacterium]|nr:MAG: type II toxin-antitoxin system PemK/MazF family toxin [Flavobacteriales bacterium]